MMNDNPDDHISEQKDEMSIDRFNELIRKIHIDEIAFNEVYNHYYYKVYKHAEFKFRGQNLIPNDLAQATFMKLIFSKKKEYIENPTAWLYVICDRIAFSILKKDGPPTEELTEDIPYHVAISSALDDREESEPEKRLRALDGLSRKILYLRHIEGYNLLEISKMLNLGYANIRQKYSRAIKFLKNL